MFKPATSPSLGPDVGKLMKAVTKYLTLREVSTHGHWLQLEARDEINAMMK
jgi:soluble epoxide hydrolase/lipid-phosphate phosphatase